MQCLVAVNTKYSSSFSNVDNVYLNEITRYDRAYCSWYTRHWQGDVTQRWVPNVLFAVLCIVCASGVYFLPETFQKALEDTFSEKTSR